MFNSFLVCAPSILPIKSSTARLDTPEILADPFLLAVLLPKRERSSKPGCQRHNISASSNIKVK